MWTAFTAACSEVGIESPELLVSSMQNSYCIMNPNSKYHQVLVDARRLSAPGELLTRMMAAVFLKVDLFKSGDSALEELVPPPHRLTNLFSVGCAVVRRLIMVLPASQRCFNAIFSQLRGYKVYKGADVEECLVTIVMDYL
jgi:hypothetical protein